MVNLYDIFEITPLWKKQTFEDSHLNVSMLIGILGLTSSFFTFQIWFTSKFSRDLIALTTGETPIIFDILSNFFLSTLVGFLIIIIVLFLLLRSSVFYKNIDITSEWESIRETIRNFVEIEPSNNEKLILIRYILTTFMLGYLAGIYYSVILYIPLFLVYITGIFIFLNIIPVTAAIISSLLISWSVVHLFLIRNKMEIKEEKEQKQDFQSDFQFSQRTFNILASGKDPMICPACKSYIPSDSKRCQVCEEALN